MTERYEKSPAGRLGFRLSKKAKKQKKRPGKKLAVAKPCIFAQQSASHAANAAKKGWRLRPQARVGAVRSLPCGQPR